MEMDAALREAVAHILIGLALLLFGLVLALLALNPNAGFIAAIALLFPCSGLFSWCLGPTNFEADRRACLDCPIAHRIWMAYVRCGISRWMTSAWSSVRRAFAIHAFVFLGTVAGPRTAPGRRGSSM